MAGGRAASPTEAGGPSGCGAGEQMGRRNFNLRTGGWLRGAVVGGHGGLANVSSDSPGKRGGGRVVSRASKGIRAVSSQDRAPRAGQSSDDARGRVRTGRQRAQALLAADMLPLLTVSPLFLFPHQSAHWFLIGRAILIMKIARENQKPFSTSVVLITFSHSCVASSTIAFVFPWLVSRLSERKYGKCSHSAAQTTHSELCVSAGQQRAAEGNP